MFTPEELKNISALIGNVQIKGSDALVVAQLQLKINKLLTNGKEETKPNKGKQDN